MTKTTTRDLETSNPDKGLRHETSPESQRPIRMPETIGMAKKALFVVIIAILFITGATADTEQFQRAPARIQTLITSALADLNEYKVEYKMPTAKTVEIIIWMESRYRNEIYKEKYHFSYGLGSITIICAWSNCMAFGIPAEDLMNEKYNIRQIILTFIRLSKSFKNIDDIIGAYNMGATGLKEWKAVNKGKQIKYVSRYWQWSEEYEQIIKRGDKK